ncbi:MAG: hypothetical protein HQ514_09795, partial [Rhodospirillales bacterium]|nr:hypothetical protein [Rhodospirillales bacterium]
MPEAVAIGEEGDIENDTQAKLPAKLIVASNSDIEEKTAALSYHSGDPISEDDLQTAGQAGDQAGAIGFGPTTQDYALIGETSPGFDFGAQAFSGGNSGSGSGQSGVSGGSAQSGSTGGQQIASAGSTGTSGSSGSAGGTTNTGGETGNT